MPDRDLMLQVRSANLADLDALLALEQASFAGDRLSRRAYRRHLQSPTALVLAVDGRDRLAGSAVVLFRRDSRVARLYSLAVDADLRGRGVGHLLLEAVERMARARGCHRMRLEVRADNRAAQALYERAGFRRGRLRRAYYEDGVDAWQYETLLEVAPG